MEDKREPRSIPGWGLLWPSPGVCHVAACLLEPPTAALAGLCRRDRVAGVQRRGGVVLPGPSAELGEFCAMSCDSAFMLCRLLVLLGIHPSS